MACLKGTHKIFGGKFAASINDTAVPVAKFAIGVVDTGGKFATGVVDTSGKFSAGIVDTGGKFAIDVIVNGGES